MYDIADARCESDFFHFLSYSGVPDTSDVRRAFEAAWEPKRLSGDALEMEIATMIWCAVSIADLGDYFNLARKIMAKVSITND